MKILKKLFYIINDNLMDDGGITEKNIVEYAKCGVDFVSVGALTHSISNFS